MANETIAGTAAGTKSLNLESAEDMSRQVQGFTNINIMAGKVYTKTSAGANTEFEVDIDLKDSDGAPRLPVGYMVIGQDKAGTTYDGTTANTVAKLYLRNDVATVALKLWVF